jgi:hypothetical protein
MDQGRKRVIGIMAAILTSLHVETADDLFGTPQEVPGQTSRSPPAFSGQRRRWRRLNAMDGEAEQGPGGPQCRPNRRNASAISPMEIRRIFTVRAQSRWGLS